MTHIIKLAAFNMQKSCDNKQEIYQYQKIDRGCCLVHDIDSNTWSFYHESRKESYLFPSGTRKSRISSLVLEHEKYLDTADSSTICKYRRANDLFCININNQIMWFEDCLEEKYNFISCSKIYLLHVIDIDGTIIEQYPVRLYVGSELTSVPLLIPDYYDIVDACWSYVGLDKHHGGELFSIIGTNRFKSTINYTNENNTVSRQYTFDSLTSIRFIIKTFLNLTYIYPFIDICVSGKHGVWYNGNYLLEPNYKGIMIAHSNKSYINWRHCVNKKINYYIDNGSDYYFCTESDIFDKNGEHLFHIDDSYLVDTWGCYAAYVDNDNHFRFFIFDMTPFNLHYKEFFLPWAKHIDEIDLYSDNDEIEVDYGLCFSKSERKFRPSNGFVPTKEEVIDNYDYDEHYSIMDALDGDPEAYWNID